MAYDKKYLIERSLKFIKEKKLVFIEDLVGFLPICKKTFYNQGLHEVPDIKKDLDNNKCSHRVALFNKWVASDNATLQIAAFKLICTEEQAHRLNATKRDIKVEEINHSTLLDELDDEDEVEDEI